MGFIQLKQVAKSLLPPIALSATRRLMRRSQDNVLQDYINNGKIPWSQGYSIYKMQHISSALGDSNLLRAFRCGATLPLGYGVGVDERCIEYPWLVSHLRDGWQILLDAGSVLNQDFILAHPIFSEKRIDILTLAPEANCYWQKGISYFFHDLRDIPIRDNYYDVIACLSTLEHIGCDNTFYTHDESHKERRPEDFAVAMKELRRVLKPGGILLLTVPFGVYQYFGTFQQFDRELLTRAIEAFGAVDDISESFYRYSADGWTIADAADCAECEYVAWITKVNGQLPESLPVEPDLAAAARAVACVRLVKG
jgi:SAM-dependent methyltransferase